MDVHKTVLLNDEKYLFRCDCCGYELWSTEESDIENIHLSVHHGCWTGEGTLIYQKEADDD